MEITNPARLFRIVSLALVLAGAIAFVPGARLHAQPPLHEIAEELHYEMIGNWSADRLNEILTAEFPAFSGQQVQYSPAKHGVRLYRVHYASVIPEQGNRPIRTSGLVAVPDMDGGSFPLVSYQHGTVYGKEEVPSMPEHSPETQVMIAQFAGQGYIVIGADYFGMGDSDEPEGYMVKDSHQQATIDMLFASQKVIRDLGFESQKLFLAGWSQGGFVTTALLEKLEAFGLPVEAAATASAPIDLAAAMKGMLFFPREIDARWIGTTFILSSFAYEHYYNAPGLAASVINPAHYEAARKAFLREPVEVADIPMDLKELLRPEYFDPGYFQTSPFGRLMTNTQAYRRVIRTPTRNYYGDTDEAIPVGIARLAMIYQQSLGDGNDLVQAISTGDTDHRGTYAVAVPEWKSWFDELAQ